MIPDGTSPEAIVIVIVIATLVGCSLMAALFWYRFPESHKKIVNRFQVVMSPARSQTEPDEQTDRQTDYVSEADHWLDRMEVDRTKTALIELLVYSGWDVGQIRSVVKGDNGAIGTEIEAARNRLGITAEPRQLRVRDAEGERLIPMET
jgi:hypothetical protein